MGERLTDETMAGYENQYCLCIVTAEEILQECRRARASEKRLAELLKRVVSNSDWGEKSAQQLIMDADAAIEAAGMKHE